MTPIRQETQIELGKRELFSLCAGTQQAIVCNSGEVWITFDGRQEDVILKVGGRIELTGQPGIVVSALQDSRISLISTVGCRLEREPSVWAAVRRVRWRFPQLSSFPAFQIR